MGRTCTECARCGLRCSVLAGQHIQSSWLIADSHIPYCLQYLLPFSWPWWRRNGTGRMIFHSGNGCCFSLYRSYFTFCWMDSTIMEWVGLSRSATGVFRFNAIYVADPFFSLWPGIAFIVLLILRKGPSAKKILVVVRDHCGNGYTCAIACSTK